MGDMETLRLRVHAKVTKDFNCWNCWSTQHDHTRCKKPQNGLLQRELLRIGWKQPLPKQPKYMELLNRVKVCYNCWESDRHGTVQCPKPKKSVKEREKKRVEFGFPLLNSWKAELSRFGVTPMEIKEEAPAPVSGEGWGDGVDFVELPNPNMSWKPTPVQIPKASVAGGSTPSTNVVVVSQQPKEIANNVAQAIPLKIPQVIGPMPTAARLPTKNIPEKAAETAPKTVPQKPIINSIPEPPSSKPSPPAPTRNIPAAGRVGKENAPVKTDKIELGIATSPQVAQSTTSLDETVSNAAENGLTHPVMEKKNKIQNTREKLYNIAHEEAMDTTEVANGGVGGATQSATDSEETELFFVAKPTDGPANIISRPATESAATVLQKNTVSEDDGKDTNSEAEGGVKRGASSDRVKNKHCLTVEEKVENMSKSAVNQEKKGDEVVAKSAKDGQLAVGIVLDSTPPQEIAPTAPQGISQPRFIEPVYVELSEITSEIPREISSIGVSVHPHTVLLNPQSTNNLLLQPINSQDLQLNQTTSNSTINQQTVMYTMDPIKLIIQQQNEVNKKTEYMYTELTNKLSVITRDLHINSTVFKHLAPDNTETLKMEQLKNQFVDQHQNLINQMKWLLEQKEKFVDDQKRLLEYNLKVVEEQKLSMDQKDQLIEELKMMLEQGDITISQQQVTIKNKDRVIESLNNALERNAKVIEEHERTLKEADKIIKHLSSLSLNKSLTSRAGSATLSQMSPSPARSRAETTNNNSGICLQMLNGSAYGVAE